MEGVQCAAGKQQSVEVPADLVLVDVYYLARDPGFSLRF